MMVVVKFSSTEEFIQELTYEQYNVARSIVRATAQYRYGKLLTDMSLVATFQSGDQIVRLEKYLGNYIPQDSTAKEKCWNKYSEEMAMLEGACQDLGLQLRAGILYTNETESREGRG